MQDLVIQTVQTFQYWEDVEKNLEHFSVKIDELGSADLIVLPEMFQTSFSMNTQLAEEWEESRTKAFLIEKALQKNAAIYTSYMVKENGNFRNRGVFVQPDGTVQYYDKRKGFGLAKEPEFFQNGTERQIVNYRGWNLQLQICYDLRFPEISRNNVKNSNGEPAFDVLLYVANWPAKRSLHWDTLLQARAIENQCYCIGVNRTGHDGNGFEYNGHSTIINALGVVIGSCEEEDCSIKTTLSWNELKEIRQNLPFLKDQSDY